MKEIKTIVVGSAILSLIYEVSIENKPLNVTKSKSLKNLKFENFLASASYQAINFSYTFEDGYKAKFKIGKRIYEATITMMESQSSGNTSLGSLMLLIPLITASAYCFKKFGTITFDYLKESVKEVLDSSNTEDSIYIGKAILATNPSWLIEVKEYDLTKKGWIEEIKSKRAKPKDFMKVGEEFDLIAFEYCHDFKITFEESYPYFIEMLKKYDLNKAALATFVYLLSKKKDSHIYRKFGKEIAERIRSFAEKAIENYKDPLEVAKIIDFEFSNLGYNAGAIADLLVADLYLLFLLEGSKKYI